MSHPIGTPRILPTTTDTTTGTSTPQQTCNNSSSSDGRFCQTSNTAITTTSNAYPAVQQSSLCRRPSSPTIDNNPYSGKAAQPPPGTYKGTYRKPICWESFTQHSEQQLQQKGIQQFRTSLPSENSSRHSVDANRCELDSSRYSTKIARSLSDCVTNDEIMARRLQGEELLLMTKKFSTPPPRSSSLTDFNHGGTMTPNDSGSAPAICRHWNDEDSSRIMETNHGRRQVYRDEQYVTDAETNRNNIVPVASLNESDELMALRLQIEDDCKRDNSVTTMLTGNGQRSACQE